MQRPDPTPDIPTESQPPRRSRAWLWWTIGIIGGFFVLIFVIGALVGDGESDNAQTSAATKPAASVSAASNPGLSKDEQCMRNAQCAVDRTHWTSGADVYCREHIQNYAKYDYEWTDGWAEPKFDRIVVQSDGKAIRYLGSSLKFQNGFGAWQRMRYSCLFDPINDIVYDVSVQSYN